LILRGEQVALIKAFNMLILSTLNDFIRNHHKIFDDCMCCHASSHLPARGIVSCLIFKQNMLVNFKWFDAVFVKILDIRKEWRLRKIT
jgi:hypothetical protein